MIADTMMLKIIYDAAMAPRFTGAAKKSANVPFSRSFTRTFCDVNVTVIQETAMTPAIIQPSTIAETVFSS